MKHFFRAMYLFIPLTAVAYFMHWPPLAIMTLASLSIVPLAKLMGEACEHISNHTGPTIGGIVSATFGNACELIIALIALRAGLIEVVKASITGSIIANLLLVLGGSMLAGGLKHEQQSFNRNMATTGITMLAITAFSLLLPGVLHHVGGADSQLKDTNMAVCISVVLIVLYASGLLFSLRTHKHLFVPVAATEEAPEDETYGWSLTKSISVLGVVTLIIVGLSEALVSSVEHAAETLGMTPIFVGVILLAIVGNAAENSAAIMMARKNKMDLSLNIVLGSSMQIAMFVAPVLVIAGFFMHQPMDLVFSQAENIAVFSAVFLGFLVLQDGKTNWLEGIGLLGLYAILGISFYFI